MKGANILGLQSQHAIVSQWKIPLHIFNQKVAVAEVAWTLEAVAFHQLVVGVGVAST